MQKKKKKKRQTKFMGSTKYLKLRVSLRCKGTWRMRYTNALGVPTASTNSRQTDADHSQSKPAGMVTSAALLVTPFPTSLESHSIEQCCITLAKKKKAYYICSSKGVVKKIEEMDEQEQQERSMLALSKTRAHAHAQEQSTFERRYRRQFTP